MKLRTRLVALSVWLFGSVGAGAELPKKPVLTLAVAREVAAAAEAEALRQQARVVIAVVDDGGHLVLLERLDNTQVASSDVAIAKAKTAAIFRRPSKVFEDQVRDGRIAAVTLPGATPLQGGLPLIVDDQVIGAIGVSGESPQQDEAVAAVGRAALAAAVNPVSAAVTYIPAGNVTNAFAKGAALKETPAYKVYASRRDAPGLGEVHQRDTDVIYVLDGSATFVTGGTLVDPKTVTPNEVRGPSIEGGDTHQLASGDVIVIPAGTPRWFSAVKAPLTYFVVKPGTTAGVIP